MDAKSLTQNILNFRIEKDCFKRSISSRSDKMSYRFYDGPPFASGVPHYGHLLSSSIKDLVPRYWTMLGYRVERVWGWDCHGLPVENQIEKKLGIQSKQQIEDEVGIDKFTDECRQFVLNVNDERSRFVNHLGRWVDFDNAYFTMNTDFMESVMNVFGTLYKTNYIFKGFKVGGYCPRCATTLSNHEINEGYQTKQDQALTVKFNLDMSKNEKYETTEDGCVEIAAGVIKDEQGRLCMINHTKENLWLVPGGKVERGENLEISLKREMKEELGVDVVSHDFVGAVKIIHQGKAYKINFFDIQISGTPQIMEKDKAQDLKWVGKIDSQNKLGFALKVEGIIIDDENQIKHDFVDFWLYEMLKSNLKDSVQNIGNADFNFLAWTTTPWTLPSNMFLAVNEEVYYSIIFDLQAKEYYVLANDLVGKYYKDTAEYVEIYTLRGKELLDVGYKPLFDFYRGNTQIPQSYKDNSFKILKGEFVSTADGTGIVHIAPAFGADDYEAVCKYSNFNKEDVSKWIFMPIDEYGKFTSDAPKYGGMRVFDVNKQVITDLKEEKKIVKIETISHSYPYCRRCDTPLIYRAIDSWFVNETDNKEKILGHAKDLNFVPGTIKNRFDNILESAPDWNISRKRYWGTPLPIWENENNPNDRLVLSNIDEIYQNTKTGSNNITKVLLVRHGETDYNVQHLHDSYGKAVLNEKGEKQSQEIKENLNEKLGVDLVKKDFVIYLSPLQRCVQTINPFVKEALGFDLFESDEYKQIKAKYEDFLENLNPLDPEERKNHIYKVNENIIFDFSLAEIYVEQYQDKFVHFEPMKFNDEPVSDGGESVKKVYQRVNDFVQRTLPQHNGKTVIVVSHGEPLTHFIKSLYNFNYEARKFTFMPSKGEIKTYYFDTNISRGVDLHRPHVDKFWFYINGQKYVRIPDVLDCWFESGSMPYGEIHYPFENKPFNYPADFIAEGLDQTRGWFRALHVIGSLFKDKKAFKNAVVNGLILAEDGKKMAKKLKNYPDPKILIDQYGADAFRIYTLGTPIVRSEPIRFSEKGVEQTLKDFLIPLQNVYNFFETYAKIDGFASSGNEVFFADSLSDFADEEFIKILMRTNPDMIYGKHIKELAQTLESYLNKEIQILEEDNFDNIITSNRGKNILIIGESKYASKIFENNYGKALEIQKNKVYDLPTYEINNELDKWILAEFNSTLSQVDDYMQKYVLDFATKAMTDFMDKLTNWYLRRSRRRFWESGMNADKISAYNTLFDILTKYLKLAAPFAPFITEDLWLKLNNFTHSDKNNDSIHLQYLPIFMEQYVDGQLMDEIAKVREIIKLALYVRAKNKVKVKQPLGEIQIRI